MSNQLLDSFDDDLNTSKTQIVNDFDTSQLLNSSFFSSESVDVIDHSRSFRNSLVLREMSDFNLAASLEQNRNESLTQDITHHSNGSQPSTFESTPKKSPFKAKKNETKTVNMSTSPSLSALAELLNEKSKNADRKMKSSLQHDTSILEEDEEDEETGNDLSYNLNNTGTASLKPNLVLSPNLIDLNDDDNSTMPSGHVFVPSANAGYHNSVPIEQPDFLTTPKLEQQPLNTNRDTYELRDEPIQEANEEIESLAETNVPITFTSNGHIEEALSQHARPTEFNIPVTVERQDSGLDDDNVTLIGEAERAPQQSNITNWTRVPEHHDNNRFRNNISNDNSRNDGLLNAGHSVSSRAPTSRQPQESARTPKSAPKKSIPKGKPIVHSDLKAEKQKKRRSLFSFFQKKPSKERDDSKTMVRSSSLQAETKLSNKKIANSLRQRSASTTLDNKSFAPVEKKVHSNSNNLFNAFRKNNSQSQIYLENESSGVSPTINNNVEPKETSDKKLDERAHLQEPLQLPKRRTNHEAQTPKEAQRKATPLDFENALNTEITDEENTLSLENLTATEQLASGLQPPKYLSPRISDNGSRRDSGEVYFPKLLDEDEIDYITQIERNRSIRSSSRRRSTDTLSIKAHSDGMTVFEASDVILATPDLSKSPTSSILKNMGTFETAGIDQEFALGSIEERLNELSMTYDEIPNNLIEFNDDKIQASPNNKFGQSRDYNDVPEDNDDNDLMNDIMEFANIIDFGDGINLDLDVNQNSSSVDDYQPRTFNPNLIKTNNLNQNNVLQNPPVKDTLKNSGLGLQFKQDENIGQGYPSKLDTPMTADTEQFEDEPFNETEFNPTQEPEATPNPTTSPHMEGYLAHNYSTLERPISMSFNGLMGKAMQNSTSSFNVDQVNPDQRVKFSSKIILYETYDEFEYDRHPDISTCNQLTPQLAQMIKAELNELKGEMDVHEESRCYTQFF